MVSVVLVYRLTFLTYSLEEFRSIKDRVVCSLVYGDTRQIANLKSSQSMSTVNLISTRPLNNWSGRVTIRFAMPKSLRYQTQDQEHPILHRVPKGKE